MQVEDVKRLNWKQSPGMVAVQARLAALEARETKERDRVEALSQVLRDGDHLLLQAKASEMLGESSLESVEMIQRRLESAQREITDLQSTLEALQLAKTKLEPVMKAAMSEARLEVGVKLAPVYRKATEELRELLTKAAAVNQLLVAVHDQAMKCDLRRESQARPDLKALGFPMSLNFLSLHNGQPSEDLKRWHDHIDTLYGVN